MAYSPSNDQPQQWMRDTAAALQNASSGTTPLSFTTLASRSNIGVATITITASTSPATLIAAAGAGVYTDILDVRIVNTSATATEVRLSDGTNTYEYYAPAGDMRGITLQVPDTATTANTAWTATTVTSVSSVKITVKYAKNQ